jgi:hypothetical protein
MVTTTDSEKWHLVVLWLAVTSAAPFLFFAGIPGHPYEGLIGAVVLFASISLFVKGKISVNQKGFIFCLLVQSCALLIFSIYYDSYVKLTNIVIQIICFIILLIYAQNFVGLGKVCHSFILLVLVMVVSGGVAFFLAGTGLFDPLWEFPRPGSGDTMYSYALTFTNFKISIGDKELIRYSGYFDEPGRMGFYAIYALLINKLSINKSSYEVIIILFGLLTLSLAFAISVFIYLIWFYGRKGNIIYFFSFILFVAALGWYIYENRNTSPRMELLSQHTVERVMPAEKEDRIIQGNNRAEGFVANIGYLLEQPVLGYDPSFFQNRQLKDPSSIMTLLVRYGFVGTLVFFIHVIYVLSFGVMKYRDKWVALGILVILGANYIQRPQVTGLLNFLMFSLILYRFKEGKRK